MNLSIDHVALMCFLLALIHTFSTHFFKKTAQTFPEGSLGENFFHLLSEVEVVFGLWAGIFILFCVFHNGLDATTTYLENKSFAEPLFVFVIMVSAATRPIMSLAKRMMMGVSRVLPFSKTQSTFMAILILGPLLGSFITEPAAMTVTALLLRDLFFSKNVSEKFKYATLGVLFVNVSVGGALTPYAAPPILMVAGQWGWDVAFMMKTFGWRVILMVVTNGVALSYFLRAELKNIFLEQTPNTKNIPLWVVAMHAFFIFLFVYFHEHPALFIPLFLFFMGLIHITDEYQTELKLRESLLVAFFLGGLVILGDYQGWWISMIMSKIESLTLYFGATALTAITDNAALTYIGSQTPHLSDPFKYFLVAGSITGGGLTVIANAPNPAGYSILQGHFDGGISALTLFIYALAPTLVACVFFLI